MVEKIVELGNLYDFYGKLLNKKQNLILYQYYINNLSLSEIGENLNVSRQNVYDSLKRAEKKLYDYEDKLKLFKKFEDNRIKMEEILEIVTHMENNTEIANKSKIENIKRIASEILD